MSKTFLVKTLMKNYISDKINNFVRIRSFSIKCNSTRGGRDSSTTVLIQYPPVADVLWIMYWPVDFFHLLPVYD